MHCTHEYTTMCYFNLNSQLKVWSSHPENIIYNHGHVQDAKVQVIFPEKYI